MKKLEMKSLLKAHSSQKKHQNKKEIREPNFHKNISLSASKKYLYVVFVTEIKEIK